MVNEKKNARDNRILAIFALVTLLVGIFGTIGLSVFDEAIALVFAIVATILTVVFGIMSWSEKLARVAVIATGVIFIIVIVMGVFFFGLRWSSGEVEHRKQIKRTKEHQEQQLAEPEVDRREVESKSDSVGS